MNKEVERVRKQMKKSYIVFLAILLLGIGSLAYNFMNDSYAFEIVFFFSFIAAMIIIKYLPIIILPARFSKVINSILIVLGFIIIALIFTTIWTNITFPFEKTSDTIDPDTIGILNRLGTQINYAVLTSTSLFLTVILLNKKNVWTSPMLLAILGLVILLLPFVLLYLIKFYGLLKGL